MKVFFNQDRKELAQVLNSGNYPILKIRFDVDDMEKPQIVKGDNVRFEYDSRSHGTMLQKTQLWYCIDPNDKRHDKRYFLNCSCTCLHDSFSYEDAMELVSDSQSPIVKPGQVVAVVQDFPKYSLVCVRMMKVSERYNVNCSTVAMLEDVEDTYELLPWRFH